MRSLFKDKRWHFALLLSLVVLFAFGFFFILKTRTGPLSDFGNSYYPALAVRSHHGAQLNFLYDVEGYNKYVNTIGDKNLLLDFYLNTPFTCTFFLPFAALADPVNAKLIFNLFSLTMLVISFYLFFNRFLPHKWHSSVALIPLLFFFPLINHISTGQSYFICLAFVLIGYELIDTRYKVFGYVLFSLAILIKIFPIFFILPLLVKKRFKDVLYISLTTTVLLLVSIIHLGADFWLYYFKNVLWAAAMHSTSIDNHYSAQSVEIFLKNILVKDNYYNPGGWSENGKIYHYCLFLFKASVSVVIVRYICQNRSNQLAILGALVFAYFLLQNRTASYAQLFWIIPVLVVLSGDYRKIHQLLFLMLVGLMVNWPYWYFENASLLLLYGRLWLCLGIFLYFFFILNAKLGGIRAKYMWVILIYLPLLLKTTNPPKFDYVFSNRGQFVTYNYEIKKNKIIAYDLGKNGYGNMVQDINVNAVDSISCIIKGDELYYMGRPTGIKSSVIKKPLIVNKSVILYLTDRNSRYGWLTLQRTLVKDL